MQDKGSLWMPEAASSFAGEIDSLFYFVTWVSTILFVGIVAAMLFLAYRYRRSSSASRLVEPNKLIEISWIIIPTILVLVVFNWGFKSFIKLNIAPPDSYEIRVTGSQWLWVFEYPNGTQTTNEVHVPVGRPVRMVMSSTDVLHSLFIPAFRVKMDVLPDRYTSIWFEATRAGEYHVFCTEYCGTQHSGMLATLVAQSQDEFNEWLRTAGVPEDMPLLEMGEMLYRQQACNNCHSLDGSQVIGPTFQGLYGRERQMQDGSTVTADENYLRESIIAPAAKIVAGFPPVMPDYSRLEERQVTALIEFIKEQ
jgi:cytochrome c oxidase subunit II